MKYISPIILLLLSFRLHAQIVTVYPHFPKDTSTITVVFDATKGNAGLAGYGGTVYMHTGVTTGAGTWQHTQGTWGTADPKVQMNSLGGNKYSLRYNIKTFYGTTAGETVTALSFVFRDQSGNTVGKTANSEDIFYPIATGGLQVMLLSPNTSPIILKVGDNLLATAVSSAKCKLTVYDNASLQTQLTNVDSIGYQITASSPGKHKVKVEADNGSTTVADSFYYVVTPPLVLQAVPAGWKTGVNYLDDSTAALVLTAPKKQNVFVIGEFNSWSPDTSEMMRLAPDSATWWVALHHLTKGQEYAYQYLVDGVLKVADPYSQKVLDPYNDKYITPAMYPGLKAYPAGQIGVVSVLQTGQTPYQWQTSSFTKPAKTDLVIYELLVRDFLSSRTYNTLKDTLGYLKTLGINAIELMPINEFEGNDSWGYNPDFYFAPDKYYGTKDALKAFIDEAHAQGIAVIMDIALNHTFGLSPLVRLYATSNVWPSADNPWLNGDQNTSKTDYQGKHPFGVGYDFNHESAYTKKLFCDVTRYWVEEFKIDGYRFDLSKGFTQKYSGDDVGAWGAYDQSRIDIWKRYADSLFSVNPQTYIILEHFADNSEEKILSNYGMMLWGNLNYAYNQASMGYASGSDVGWISYKARGWNDPHVVGYMESHDEERLMYRNLQYGAAAGTYSVKNLNTALERVKLVANVFLTIPGPKMIWQFGELGYDVSIDAGGRVGAKPLKWNYYSVPARYSLYRFYATLINLKTTSPTFRTTNYTLDVSGLGKRVRLDATMNAVALSNCNITSSGVVPAFPHTGKWYEYYTGDSITVTDGNAAIALAAGEYRLYTDKKLPAPDLGPDLSTFSATKKEEVLLHIFPNPAQQQVQVTFVLNKPQHVVVKLYDLDGRKVDDLFTTSAQTGLYTSSYDVSLLPAGVYFVKLSGEGGQATQKLVVQH